MECVVSLVPQMWSNEMDGEMRQAAQAADFIKAEKLKKRIAAAAPDI